MSARPKRTWSAAAERKLRQLYGRESLARLAFLLKRTQKAVRSRAKLRGIKMGKRRQWTRSEDKIMRSRFPHERTATLACDLGRTVFSLHNRAHNLGLSKSAAYLASPDACRLRRGQGEQAVGFKHRFQKGIVPANKGLRRPGYAPGRMASTQFKKGQKPHTYRFKIGDQRINSDGYIDVKIREDLKGASNWRPLHRILWEKEHGPVPPGHVVAFRDGEKLHCTLENLDLLTLGANLCRNSIWKTLPKELAQIAQLKGAIQRQINKRLGRREDHSREYRNATRRAVRNAKRIARQG